MKKMIHEKYRNGMRTAKMLCVAVTHHLGLDLCGGQQEAGFHSLVDWKAKSIVQVDLVL